MQQGRNAVYRTVLLGLFLVVLAIGIVSAPQFARLVSAPTPSNGAVMGTYFDHVVIIVMENEGVYDICRSSPPPCLTSGPAPYMAGLANNYTIGAQYLSLITTSQPNYVGLLSGSMQGCTSSGCPSPITAPNLVDRFEAAGLTWKGYFENQALPRGCDFSSPEPYAAIHNPFIVFQDITNNTARCNKLVNVNPNSCGSVIDCTLVNDLNNATAPAPNFMWLTPNDCDNMRGSSVCGTSSLIGPGNTYLSKLVPTILNSRTFTTTRSALFITFDEGNNFCPGPSPPIITSQEDCVYASWSGPVTKTHFGTGNLYNHYSFTKTIESNWNLASLTSNDANAKVMTEFFKSTTPPVLLSTSFTYSPSSPQVGQPVWFTASASGGTGPYNFTWAFGDGATGAGATTYHTYSTAGSYNILLTAKDSSQSPQTATSQQTITITSPPPPPPGLAASFTESPSSAVVGQTISFTGSASGGTSPYSYAWNFGDSSTGSGSSVSHGYQTAGVYTVVLTVTDAAGHIASASNTVTVTSPLSASFTYSPSNPSVLTNVQFTATATGGTGPYSYSWDFGDGSTGTGASATHSYLLPGTYTVILTVVDANRLTTTASTKVTVVVSVRL
jgi:PKD repeat protein